MVVLWYAVAIAGAIALVMAGTIHAERFEEAPLWIHLTYDGIGKGVALGAALTLHAVLARGEKGRPARPAGAVLAGSAAAVAFLPVMIGITWVQQRAYEAAGMQFEVQAVVQKAVEADDSTFLVFAFFAVVAAPLFEEVLFRGFLHGGLRRWMGPWGTAVLSAAAFAAYHMEADVLPALFVLGLALAWLRERTGGLLAPIAMHACYNAVQVVGILSVRGG